MFGGVWKWAGSLRQIDLNLGVAWHQLPGELQGLFDDLTFWETHWTDVIEQAAHLHHRAARIHPFLNGNGRWARMLSNIWLLLHRAPLTAWPEETISRVSAIREEYLAALRDADRGRMTAFVQLHRRFATPDS